MHEILHIIGLCPDSFSHTSVIEIAVTNYQTIHDLLSLNIKNYVDLGKKWPLMNNK